MIREIWKDVIGYEGLYQVSNLGRVKSLSRKMYYNHSKTKDRYFRISKDRIIKTSLCKGYKTLTLSKEGKPEKFRNCRLVALNHIDNPENKPCVNHIDGNKSNDSVSNLEWCTYAENTKHAVDIGLIKYKMGSENHLSIKVKCSETNIVFGTISEAAKHVGCDVSHLSRMLRGIYNNKTSLVYV